MIAKRLSENINKVKVILPQVYYPVPSSKAGFLFRKGKLYNNNLTGFEGEIKGHIVLHCVNNTIKDKSGLPKLTFLTKNVTLGGLREDNSYVYRGPVVAAPNRINTNGLVYVLVKTERKSMGPAWLISREYSTGTGRTNNVLKRLDSLRKRSQNNPDKIIDRNLYRDFVLDPRMYLAAYQKLKSKPGSMTPGITPTTLDGLSMDEVLNIIHLLMDENFQFTPGRRIYISKPSGNKRPLTIGNPRDKLVQGVIRLVLEAIYEPLFLPCSHGFRPKFSCHTALREIYTKFVGCSWWIEGDFQSCFDSIDHDKLMMLLSNKISDQRFLQLIRKSLKAGYFDFREHKTDFVGTPQGSIISPILANIFLHELDKFVMGLKNDFEPKVTRNRRSTEYWQAHYKLKLGKRENKSKEEIRKLIKNLQSTRAKKLDDFTKRIMYIRYTDDWIIAVNGSYTETKYILNKIKNFCFGLGLTISPTKTKITNSYKDYILFLGTRIKHSGVTTWSKHKGGYRQRNRKALMLTAPMVKIRRKLSLSGFVKNNRGVSRTSWTPLTLRQIIHNYNSILRGYSNYYSFIINRGQVMSWLFYVLRDSAARTIAHKLSLGRRAKVYKKFGMMLTIWDYEKRQKDTKPTKAIQLFKPDLKLNAWGFKTGLINHNIAQFYADTISLAQLDNLKCVLCSSTYRIEMHHVRMMKDLSLKTKTLDKLMAQANRKQVPLCRYCHMKYHGGRIIITAARPIEKP
jgi:nicotine oxidoreductase